MPVGEAGNTSITQPTTHVNARSVSLSLIIASLLTCGTLAEAQTVVGYWDFTQYGTVSGGSSVTSNVYGSLSGTLSSSSTSLTSSGLAVTGTALDGTTGITLDSGSLSSFTGDFSIQTWFKNDTSVLDNTALFGGTTDTSVSGDMSSDKAFFFSFYGQKTQVITNDGTTYGTPSQSAALTWDTSTVNDLVVTYTSSTHTITTYLNGTQIAQSSNSGFASLSGVGNFAIDGVANPAFNDNSAQVTTSNFLMYDGALSSSQVSAIDALGVNASLSSINSAIPEPAPFAAIIGALALLAAFAVRRQRLAA